MATNSVATLADLVTEFEGSIYRHVPGYMAKVWPNAIPTEVQVPVTSISKTGYSPDTSPVEIHVVDDLRHWLCSVQPELLNDEVQVITTPYPFDRDLAQSTNANQERANLLIASKHTTDISKLIPGADVHVLGLVESGPGRLPDDVRVLRFCKLARDFLILRSERRFLDAFHMYNSTLELWTFDRAGAVSSEAFYIKWNPDDFVYILAKNMASSAEDIGLQEVLSADGRGGVFIDLANSPRLHLEGDAFFRPDDLIGPGTICFKAHAGPAKIQTLVAKFVWTETGSAERKLLAAANAKKVFGILKLEAYGDLGDIASFPHRQGLRLCDPYLFNLKDQKQKASVIVQATPVPSTEQESSNSQQECSNFDNLQLECLVTSPLGRHLDDFSSMAELITVFRDITKALQSLYLGANILHRDISRQNIIIVSPLSPDSPSGILIDLDNALDLSEPPPETQLLIGTSGFMACGILGGDEHTYRHDLESLFYVFLWLAICHDGVTSKNIPTSSRLQAWMGSPRTGMKWGDVFRIKRADMQPAEFLKLVDAEFREPFRQYLPLAARCHELLFPVRDGRIFIGTDAGCTAAERLYGEMIAAFESYM
jgi:hypothetical protein